MAKVTDAEFTIVREAAPRQLEGNEKRLRWALWTFNRVTDPFFTIPKRRVRAARWFLWGVIAFTPVMMGIVWVVQSVEKLLQQ